MNVHYYDGGTPGNGRPVVLIHGAGMDHTGWRYQSRYLAHHGSRVRAIDLPGHGRTPGPLMRSVEMMAEWMVEHLGPGHDRGVFLIGHSLGGLVALEASARASDAVSGLVLMSCAARMNVHPDLQAAADRRQQRAVDLIMGWSYGTRGLLAGHPEPGLSVAGATRRLLEQGLACCLSNDLAAVRAYTNCRAAAGSVQVPTLVVAGSDDRMVPVRASEELAGLIADSRFEVIDRAGHMTMLQAPDKVRTLLSSFVESIG
ncbi:MAG: alpha/beta fold hydrolase [Acidimicrobiia bacterium]